MPTEAEDEVDEAMELPAMRTEAEERLEPDRRWVVSVLLPGAVGSSRGGAEVARTCSGGGGGGRKVIHELLIFKCLCEL